MGRKVTLTMGKGKVEKDSSQLIGCPFLGSLVTSDEVAVRKALAETGYGLDILVNDKCRSVKSVAREYLEKHQAPEYKAECEKNCCENGLCSCSVMNELINSKVLAVRLKLAAMGFAPDVFINDKNWKVRWTVAKLGYGLDVLVKDKNPRVRACVARNRYGMDILVKDKSPIVRCAVAEMHNGLAILLHDKEPEVRIAVARQGYKLDILINDESPEVRAMVALQGYGLDTLINDPSNIVRQAVFQRWNLERNKKKRKK